jgi:anti-anti-sigma factor
MTQQGSDSTGRLVKKSNVPSATEDDCSTWDTQVPEVKRVTGRFVKPSLVHSAVTVDCHEWSQTPTGKTGLTDDINKSTVQSHHDRHLEAESVNGVLEIVSTQKQLDELDGEQLAELVQQRSDSTILLNLSGVDFVSASFLARLEMVQRKLKSVGGRFVVCNLSKDVQEVFSLLRLQP